MNTNIVYGSLRKTAKLVLPVDGSEDELGFSDEENEQLATQQGECEDDGDSENDEDSLIALYRTKLRSEKWYHRIVFHMIDFTLFIPWLSYCRDFSIPQRQVLSLFQFKSEVASCLCMERKKKRGRPSQHVEGDLAGKRSRDPTAPVPPEAVRFDSTDHWPAVMAIKGRCKSQGCTGIVRVQSTKCEAYLCLTVDKNCLIDFHKQ